jgi:hypothetical protein
LTPVRIRWTVPLRVQYQLGHKMGGDGSASSGSRQCNATCLTATPSAASRLLPPLSSVTSRLPDLYRECVDNGGWASLLYNAQFIFIRKTQLVPSPAVPAPPQPHKPGRPASERRRAHDKQRREAWAERRRIRSQPRLQTQSTEDDITRPATAVIATTPVTTSS